MALQDNLRAQLIKQFPADVITLVSNMGEEYYACPTCKRHLAVNNEKCPSCDQVLKWDNIRKKEMEHMGAAYMAEGMVTLAGSRLYTSAAYTEEDIDDAIARFDRVFDNCGRIG